MLSKFLIAYIIVHYLVNRFMYLFKKKKKPILTHLCIFCCVCYPLFLSPKIHKLQFFLKYATNYNRYHFLHHYTHQITISRHVTFNEFSFPYKDQSLLQSPSIISFDFFKICIFIINFSLPQIPFSISVYLRFLFQLYKTMLLILQMSPFYSTSLIACFILFYY